MKELIIFGRSPFINELDLSKIDYDRFDVCCINYPIPDIRVHYVVSSDYNVKPVLAPKTEWVSVHTGWELIKTDEDIIQEEKKLTWGYFSSSLAVNFAVLRGYKVIYLCGVDLVEENKPFSHYDGIVNEHISTKKARIKEKQYIKQIADKVEIYQANPKCDWLQYKDIGLLL